MMISIWWWKVGYARVTVCVCGIKGQKAHWHNVDLYNLQWVQSVTDVVRHGRLRRFRHLEHMEHKGVDDWVLACKMWWWQVWNVWARIRYTTIRIHTYTYTYVYVYRCLLNRRQKKWNHSTYINRENVWKDDMKLLGLKPEWAEIRNV